MSQILGAETARWPGWPACPCLCGVESLTLTRVGHVRGCSCRSCTGRRSKRKGQERQSQALKAAAKAEGRSMAVAPTHEEQARLLVHYEVKSGEQVAHAGRAVIESWEKQARDAAHTQTPRKKWGLVRLYPDGRQRITMDFREWLSLVSELVELP